MLVVNGVDLPTPSEYTVDFEEISKAERNALGTMVKDVIAYKWKISCVWKALSQDEMTRLMNAQRGNSFTLSFISMEGKRETGEFYAGTPSASAMQYKEGKVDVWLNVKMNFIEM